MMGKGMHAQKMIGQRNDSSQLMSDIGADQLHWLFSDCVQCDDVRMRSNAPQSP